MDTQEDTVTLAHHPTLTLDPRGLNQELWDVSWVIIVAFRTMYLEAKMTNLEPQIAQSSKKTQTSGSVGSSSAREDPREGSSFGSDAAHPARRNPYKSELCEKFAAGKFK
ncbi:hypothetical protein Bca101_024504 [Brassica carinata]